MDNTSELGQEVDVTRITEIGSVSNADKDADSIGTQCDAAHLDLKIINLSTYTLTDVEINILKKVFLFLLCNL